MNYKYIRIHGDNIVECERTLNLIHDAIGGILSLTDCQIFLPVYEIKADNLILNIQLLSGHGRWGINIGDVIMGNGGILRESADSYITEIVDNSEIFLLAIEYCSALPAGNNAWQRNGRAISSILAGIPYLFIAEFGGMELNGKREVIAPRYPNPIVPFSYITTSLDYSLPCVPVYKPHPSITEELRLKFNEVFGYKESLKIIKGCILHENFDNSISILTKKALKLIEILSSDKRDKTTLKGNLWNQFLHSPNRANWMIHKSNIIWKKKVSNKVKITNNIKNLIHDSISLSLGTIGVSDIPICIVPQEKISEFQAVLKKYYNKLNIIIPGDKPLAIVWITGYKPHGDDSRPDRGLSPLTKMVLGDSCRIMAIVYGPAKPKTWSILTEGLDKLVSINGLWQSIYNVCDSVLIDSITKLQPQYINIESNDTVPTEKLAIELNKKHKIIHSEHDIDTAIHQILSHSGLHECLCNPPGGDWSGINYHRQNKVYRWTSLPRVSAIGGKRPDHVFQQESQHGSIFITIESKSKGSDLENDIGINLAKYLKDLFSLVPTSIKDKNTGWRLYNNKADLGDFSVISAGAFIYKNDKELNHLLISGALDCIMAFEFGKPSVIHLLSNNNGRILINFVKEAANNISGFIIQIH